MNAGNHQAHLGRKVVEVLSQFADFVTALDLQAAGQVAFTFGNLFQIADDRGERAGNVAGDGKGDSDSNDGDDGEDGEEGPGDAAAGRFNVTAVNADHH